VNAKETFISTALFQGTATYSPAVFFIFIVGVVCSPPSALMPPLLQEIEELAGRHQRPGWLTARAVSAPGIEIIVFSRLMVGIGSVRIEWACSDRDFSADDRM